jgi:predicted nucleic acid-binding protein
MPALRCLIDSMIFDAVADEPGLLELVDRLTSARRVELLAAPTSIAQVAATPDPDRRRRLQKVRVLVVPPADDADPVARATLAALRAARGVGWDDALIGAAAAAHAVPLVTEDRALAVAAAAAGPPVAVWDWAGDLRPRILALGEEAELADPIRRGRRGRRPCPG